VRTGKVGNVNRHDHELARRLYASPDTSTMIKNLPSLGESLQNSAIDLARDCTLPKVDEMLQRIKAAESSLMHLRRSMAEQEPMRGER
jgi:hypothetical protein